jgi:hypothetical protein
MTLPPEDQDCSPTQTVTAITFELGQMNLSTCAVVGLELGEFVVLGFRIVEERVMRLC